MTSALEPWIVSFQVNCLVSYSFYIQTTNWLSQFKTPCQLGKLQGGDQKLDRSIFRLWRHQRWPYKEMESKFGLVFRHRHIQTVHIGTRNADRYRPIPMNQKFGRPISDRGGPGPKLTDIWPIIQFSIPWLKSRIHFLLQFNQIEYLFVISMLTKESKHTAQRS